MQQSDLACKHLVIVARFNVQLARQNADFTITVPKNKKKRFLSAIIRDETRNCSIVTTVPRLTVYSCFVRCNKLNLKSLTSIVFPSWSTMCYISSWKEPIHLCFSCCCIISRQGKQSLNLASAAECFLSTRSICFPFVESWFKHSYFFANTFSLSASKAAKNTIQPFWILTGCRKRLNIFAFHSNDHEWF